MRKLDEILHLGELNAQKKFVNGTWTEASLNQMFRTKFEESTVAFVEGQKFFFIATANNIGQCDASFRSTERGVDGNMQLAVKVISPTELVFPDYCGNNLFNSIGNILVNPNIGMIFIDFKNSIRLRINGKAEVIENPDLFSEFWSTSNRYILVTIDQIYWNCSKRIPKL